MPVCQHVGRATAMGGQNMQSRVKLGSFLRGIALGSTALFAALIVPAKAQDAPGQTVITAARMIDVLTGKTVEFPAIFVGADGRITNIAGNSTVRSEEHTSELQSLMRKSYAVFCLKKKKTK